MRFNRGFSLPKNSRHAEACMHMSIAVDADFTLEKACDVSAHHILKRTAAHIPRLQDVGICASPMHTLDYAFPVISDDIRTAIPHLLEANRKRTMADVTLYDRDPHYIPRVAAVHDMCGYGKCSLTSAIPILSAAGCDVCPVPTALFSAHTKYKVFTFHDTTDMLNGYLDAWQAEEVELDGVYSGFLGSPEQVAIIERLYREYPDALRLVDPVMGDGGQMYATYTPQLCEAMGSLAIGADVLMPNLTEAAILTKSNYLGNDLDDTSVNRLLEALLKLGAKNVVLKGIDHGDGRIINYVASAATGVEHKIELAHEKLPFMIHGTGDAFASALCGAVMAGRGLAESATIAGEFVRHAMANTRNQPHFEDRGLSFELNLGELTGLIGS